MKVTTIELKNCLNSLKNDINCKSETIKRDSICRYVNKHFSGNVTKVVDETERMYPLTELFTTWSLWSKDLSYPVPSDHTSEQPNVAFNRHISNDISLWNGTYGSYRKALLDHMIAFCC